MPFVLSLTRDKCTQTRRCDGCEVGERSWRRTENESFACDNKCHTKRNLNSDDWIIEPIRWYIVHFHAISGALSGIRKMRTIACRKRRDDEDEVNQRELGFFRRCSENAWCLDTSSSSRQCTHSAYPMLVRLMADKQFGKVILNNLWIHIDLLSVSTLFVYLLSNLLLFVLG